MGRYFDQKLKETLASNPDTPEEILRELATDENESVRVAVAANPLIHRYPDILVDLVTDEFYYVRMTVAAHSPLPPSTLAELAKDENDYVLEALAKNPNTPPSVLVDLAKRPFPNRQESRVCDAALEHMPLEVLCEMYNEQKNHERGLY